MVLEITRGEKYSKIEYIYPKVLLFPSPILSLVQNENLFSPELLNNWLMSSKLMVDGNRVLVVMQMSTQQLFVDWFF